MLPLPNLLYISAFSLLGIGFFITIFFVVKSNTGLWGSPSIQPFHFYSGKISMYLCWSLGMIKAIVPSFGWIQPPLWLAWLGAILLCFSSTVMLFSFYSLGTSLKYGLPDSETRLITSGIYRYSRHPLYVSVFLVCFSSVVFFPDLLNICVAGYCFTTHYLMILKEEKFLAERFGSEWGAYKKNVRRFI
jgi:protein-S-isoprenylcysteine O-methyltransferase Ste14